MKNSLSTLFVLLSYFLFTYCSPSGDQSGTNQTSEKSVSRSENATATTTEAKPIGFFEIRYGDKIYTSERLNNDKSRIYVANQANNPFLQVDLVADSSANVSLLVKLYHSRWYKESATGIYSESLSEHSASAKKEGYQIRFPIADTTGNTATKDTIALTEGKVTLTTYQEGMVVGTFDGKGRSTTKNGGALLPIKGEFKLQTTNFSNLH